MSQKSFCDICDELMKATYLAGSSMPVKDKPKCIITVEARIKFNNQISGYEGNPDVCNSCKANLLKKLYEANKK